jgi:putative transposase
MKDFYIARIVVGCLNRARETSTLAYVVMPDHVHWMLQLQSDKPLSAIVQAAKSASAHAINRRIGRQGCVWQSGFHDHAVRNHEALRALARYITANPLRAGIVKSVGDYPHWDAVWI